MTETDPSRLLDAYADETDFYRGDLLDDREHEAPKAFAALRAVLDRCDWMDAMIAEYKPYELAAFIREAIVKALEAE